MEETTFTVIDFPDFFSFVFKVKHVFIEEEDIPSEKVAMVREELEGIDIDGIENLRIYLDWLVAIDQQCVNVKVVVGDGKLTRNISKKKKPDVYTPIDVHSMTNAINESVSSIMMWNIVNRVGMHDFSCG